MPARGLGMGYFSSKIIFLPLSSLAVLIEQLRWPIGILPAVSQSLNTTPPSRKASTGMAGLTVSKGMRGYRGL